MKKNVINILLVINLFFAFNTKTIALTYGGCEYSEISRLKSLVTNINISYDYNIRDNKAYFNITLNNIVPGMYFEDSQTGNIYNYNNTTDGEITLYNYTNTSGHFKFYSESGSCKGIKLGNKYYNLPIYNKYYTDPLCIQNSNYSLCQKWADVTYSYDEFEELINKYNSKSEINEDENQIQAVYEKTFLDMLVKFYTQYYYFILIGIIVVCVTIMIISKRKNRFNL